MIQELHREVWARGEHFSAIDNGSDLGTPEARQEPKAR